MIFHVNHLPEARNICNLKTCAANYRWLLNSHLAIICCSESVCFLRLMHIYIQVHFRLDFNLKPDVISK